MANLRDSAVEEIEPVDRLASPGVGEPTGIEPRRTIGRDGSSAGLAYTVREVMRVRMAKFAAVVLFVTFIAAVFAPWLAPYDPTKSKPWDSLQAPSNKYWLGADRLGRDQLSRLIYGARISLFISVAGVSMAVVMGVLIGVTAGWYGRVWDEVLMRFMDGLSAFPNLLFALALVGITGQAVSNIILVVGIVGTPWVARVIQPGAVGASRARVHHGSHRDGCSAMAYYAQASDPQLHGSRHRPGQPRRCRSHFTGGLAELPGRGSAPAHLGRHVA